MEPLIKGDSIELEITANTDITGWKIRYEFYDKEGNSVQGATSNSGGSDDQVEITDASNGVFLVKVAKNLTTEFENQAFLEIEREDTNEKIKTIFQGDIEFKDEQITWETPS
jgi:hypothetical protein